MVELPLLELCGRMSSFQTGFIHRTTILNLKVAIDFDASQAGTRVRYVRREGDRVGFTDFCPEFFVQRGGTKDPPFSVL